MAAIGGPQLPPRSAIVAAAFGGKANMVGWVEIDANDPKCHFATVIFRTAKGLPTGILRWRHWLPSSVSLCSRLRAR